MPSFSVSPSFTYDEHSLTRRLVKQDAKGHPPANQRAIDKFKGMCEHDAAEVLLSGGVEPADIDTIIYR